VRTKIYSGTQPEPAPDSRLECAHCRVVAGGTRCLSQPAVQSQHRRSLDSRKSMAPKTKQAFLDSRLVSWPHSPTRLPPTARQRHRVLCIVYLLRMVNNQLYMRAYSSLPFPVQHSPRHHARSTPEQHQPTYRPGLAHHPSPLEPICAARPNTSHVCAKQVQGPKLDAKGHTAVTFLHDKRPVWYVHHRTLHGMAARPDAQRPTLADLTPSG